MAVHPIVPAVFGAAFTFTTAMPMGRALLRVLKARMDRLEELFFGFVCGAACLSFVVFILTALGLARASVFLATGAAAALLWRVRSDYPRDNTPLPRFWKWVFGALYGIFGLLYLTSALLPETSPDASVYHLALPARYLREHGFPHALTGLYEAFPEGMEMIFLFAFAFGKHTAAALVHFLFTLAAPIGMMSYGRRFGIPRAGVFGGLLFFLSPVVARTGTIAYVDVALASVLFAMFYALEIWRAERCGSMLLLAGLLAGFAYAIKYTGGFAIFYMLVYIAWECRKEGRGMFRPLAWASAAAFAMTAPWMVKNAVLTRNPFAPFASAYFPGPFVPPVVGAAYVHGLNLWGGIRPSQIPLELTVRGAHTGGLTGPIFLLTPLMLLALRNRAGRAAVAAAVLFAAPIFGNPGTRFLIPALPFVSLALGIALEPWPAAAAILLAIHALASWPGVMVHYCNRYAWKIDAVTFSQAWRAHKDPAYLPSRMPDYGIGLRIDRLAPPGDGIFSIQPIQEDYQDRVVTVGWQSGAGKRMLDGLQTALRDDLRPVRHHDFRFAPRSVHGLRVVQTRGASGPWSISELRVFNKDNEVARAAGWRLEARPNPWDVQLAFDGNPATRWSSAAPEKAGMFVQVDFGRAETVDRVIAECPRNEQQSELRVEYLDASGGWNRWEGQASTYDVPPGPWMRRAAVDYLKESGIHWMVVHDNDEGSRDFDIRREQWGIVPVAREGGFVLYKLR